MLVFTGSYWSQPQSACQAQPDRLRRAVAGASLAWNGGVKPIHNLIYTTEVSSYNLHGPGSGLHIVISNTVPCFWRSRTLILRPVFALVHKVLSCDAEHQGSYIDRIAGESQEQPQLSE